MEEILLALISFGSDSEGHSQKVMQDLKMQAGI